MGQKDGTALAKNAQIYLPYLLFLASLMWWQLVAQLNLFAFRFVFYYIC